MPKAFDLDTLSPQVVQNLCGVENDHIHLIEKMMGVSIHVKPQGIYVYVSRSEEGYKIKQTRRLLARLLKLAERGDLQPNDIHLAIQNTLQTSLQFSDETKPRKNKRKTEHYLATETINETEKCRDPAVFFLRKKRIKPTSDNQRAYIQRIKTQDVNFGIGPAGSGKTYLAVAAAVEAIEQQKVQRIVLTRPAVEAGENLGFLPGDLSQKVDPYLRPLFDALYDMMGVEKVEKMIEHRIIEILPLAFMRGRTLNESFVLLDEAQNTTVEQMKMFLTRLGFGSQAVITGDPSQIDLPHKIRSGLRHAMDILPAIDGIGFSYLQTTDIVRHQLVKQIVAAYESDAKKRLDTSKGWK